MKNYRIAEIKLEDDDRTAVILSVLPRPDNVRSSPADATKVGVPVLVEMGEDETAKAMLERAIDDYTGHRAFKRYNGDGDPYSVIIIEDKP